MAGKRKSPKLRVKDGCYVADFYKPDGKRSTISFGSPGARTAGDIYAAFGKWLDLFNQHPHKVLDYKDPYEAINKIVNPATIVTVGELYDKYLDWAKQYFPPLRDGRTNPDVMKVDRLGKFLSPYRTWGLSDFGPEELKAIQDAMVAYRYTRTKHEKEPTAYTRTGINQVINQVHKIWQWGVGREVVTVAQKQRLKEVQPLRIGRSSAKDKLKRSVVTEQDFTRVLDHVNSVAADLLRLIWLTAMRPSEVCRMRPFDIVRTKPECWLYIPGRNASPVGDHQTAHHRRVRAIPLTTTAQEILGRRVKDWESKEFIFRPAEALDEMRAKRFVARQTPMGQGNCAGTNRQPHPMIKPGIQYNSESLATAVKRGCGRVGVARFTPYDLRRSAATRVRSVLDKDAAKLLLGHVSTETTEIYLLDEVKEAMNVAMKLEQKKVQE